MEFAAQAINAYHTIKERVKPFLPAACAEGDGPEGAPPGYGPGGAGRHEMTQFNNYNQADGGQGYTEYGAVEDYDMGNGGAPDGHGLTGDRIDEWQAGWNVTNAIQVSG